MVIQKTKTRILVALALYALSLPFPLLHTVADTAAISMSYACQQSQECREAKQREEEANQNALSAASTANAYQSRVNELAASIAAKEAEIAMTKAGIAALNQEIKETEAKLKQEQDALAELLIKVYFDSDAEPITILAGSSSISDLAEKAARAEVVKSQISVSATKIKESKLALEKQKQEVESLLAEQEYAKQELAKSQAEQIALVEKYANDAEAYEEVATAARLAAKAAEEEYQRQHPSSANSNAYADADNTYPWQNQCPGYYYNDIHINEYGEEVYTSPSVYVYTKLASDGSFIAGTIKENDGSIIGGVLCQCTSYAGWKVYENYRTIISWGDAKEWAYRARSNGYTVDNTPEAGAVGQSVSGPYGHVFWVESVNPDGSANITEYNSWWGTYYYSGVGTMGDFGSEVIDANDADNYNYIHF